MNKGKTKAVVATLNTKLHERGSWAGETHMQKAVYFLQELLDVPLEFDFVLYKHGPFSFDLREMIGEMRSERVFELRQQPYPYGPSLIVPDAQKETLSRRFPQTLGRYQVAIDFVADELGGMRVSDLERIATALYIVKQQGDVDQQVRARCLVELKPHISFEDAHQAVRTVEEMSRRAQQITAHA